MVPFILNHVDLELFGLNALIISIVGYFNLLNLGLSSGISRFAALFYGQEKQEEISDVLRFGVKFFVSLGIIVASSLFILSFFYDKLFHIKLELVEEGQILLIIYSVASLFIWAIIPFRGILSGFQRTDIIDKIGLAIIIFNVPIAVTVLTYTGSYLLYIGLLQLVTVIVSCINIYFALKFIPNFRFSFSPISKPLRSRLIKFSGWSFVSAIFGLIIFQIDHLVIAAVLGVNAVAIYSIAFNLHNYIGSLNSLVGNPLYYAITAEFAKRDKNDRESMIINATRMHSGILIPIVIIALINIDHFILAWVGERFTSSILPCKILISYWLFNITREVLSLGVIGGKGIVTEAVKLEAFVAISNLGLSILLIKYIGITGVALGTAIPWILASFFYIFRYCNILSIPVSNFIRQAVGPNLPHFFLALILSIITQKFIKSGNIFEIIAVMSLIYVITLITGYTFLSTENKHLIKKVMVLRA